MIIVRVILSFILKEMSVSRDIGEKYVVVVKEMIEIRDLI